MKGRSLAIPSCVFLNVTFLIDGTKNAELWYLNLIVNTWQGLIVAEVCIAAPGIVGDFHHTDVNTGVDALLWRTAEIHIIHCSER